MNYDIELNANDSSVLETQYAFTQGDYGQIQFSIRVKADGVYVTNAQRAYIAFTLPNGYVVTGADMTKSVATYTYPFQGNELQVPGIIIADVKLVYTGGQISSNKFSFICRYDPLHDKSFNAGPYISQLQTFIDEAQLKINYLQTLIETLQPDVGGTTLTRSDLHNTRDAVTAGLKAIDANMAQNMLLRSDVTNQFEDDISKLAGAASVYELKDTVDTLNSNLTNDTGGSGYYSFPNGFKVCWGYTNERAITFPITFNNTPSIQLTVTGDNENYYYTAKIRAASATGFTFNTQYAMFGSAINANGTDGTYWIAIGY